MDLDTFTSTRSYYSFDGGRLPPTTFFVCSPIVTSLRSPSSPTVKILHEEKRIDFPVASTTLSISIVEPSGAAETHVVCRSMVTEMRWSAMSRAAVAATAQACGQ